MSHYPEPKGTLPKWMDKQLHRMGYDGKPRKKSETKITRSWYRGESPIRGMPERNPKVPATKQLTPRQIREWKFKDSLSQASESARLEFLSAGPGKRKKLISKRRRAKMGYYMVKRAEEVKKMFLTKRMNKKIRKQIKNMEATKNAGREIDPWMTYDHMDGLPLGRQDSMHSQISNEKWFAKEMRI